METARVESDSRCIFTDRSLPRHLKLLLVVVPDADVAGRASDDQLLPQACVHTRDLFVMEWSVNVLTPSRLNISAIKRDIHLQQLVVTINVVKYVFRAVENQLCDTLFRDLRFGNDLSILGADRVLLGAVNLGLV